MSIVSHAHLTETNITNFDMTQKSSRCIFVSSKQICFHTKEKKMRTQNTLKMLGVATTLAVLTVSSFAQVNDLAPPSRDRDPAPEPTPIETPQPESSASVSEDHPRFKVCFYPQENFRGDTFCRHAPSRVGILKARVGNNVKSIKITDSLCS